MDGLPVQSVKVPFVLTSDNRDLGRVQISLYYKGPGNANSKELHMYEGRKEYL